MLDKFKRGIEPDISDIALQMPSRQSDLTQDNVTTLLSTRTDDMSKLVAKEGYGRIRMHCDVLRNKRITIKTTRQIYGKHMHIRCLLHLGELLNQQAIATTYGPSQPGAKQGINNDIRCCHS